MLAAPSGPRDGRAGALKPGARRAALAAAAGSVCVAMLLALLLSAGARTAAPAGPRLSGAGAISAALGAGDPAYAMTAVAGGVRGSAPAQHLALHVSAAGTTFSYAGHALQLRLAAAGAPGALTPASASAPTSRANTATITHGGIAERMAAGPLGVEQSFTLARPLSGQRSQVLVLSVAGASRITSDGAGGAILHLPGGVALRYGAPSALDARGRALRTSLIVLPGALELRVEGRGAAYPLTVDPLVQGGLGARLSGGSEEIEEGTSGEGTSGEGVAAGQLGYSVALSADGNTAAVGAPASNHSAGGVWIFTRSDGIWSQDGPKLTGGEAPGSGCAAPGEAEPEECSFGRSVAISADGSTVAVGAPQQSGPCSSGTCAAQGAVWIFRRAGGTWSSSQVLNAGTEEVAGGHFGRSVALSPDGSTLVAGATADAGGRGSVWVFKRPAGGSFSPDGPRLLGSGVDPEGHMGASVAVSADGATLLAGAPGDSGYTGSARLFSRSEAGWSETQTLAGTGEVGAGRFGFSVAISADASTIMVGGRGDNGHAGAAWAFTSEGGSWKPLGGKLTGGAEQSGTAEFGYSVALSSDGSTALVGGPRDSAGTGAAWLFSRGGEGFAQAEEKLSLSGKPGPGSRALFGASLALRADGEQAVIGAPIASERAGLAWVYSDPSTLPAVESISPSAGPLAGGTTVTITGKRLAGASLVDFGATEASSFTVNSSESITAVVPAHAAGAVCVTVTTVEGSSPVTRCPTFTYLGRPAVTGLSPASGPTSGGTVVTITGRGIGQAEAVRFGSRPATTVHVEGPERLTAVTPAAPEGEVSVSVTTPGGTAAAPQGFLYVPSASAGAGTGAESGGSSVLAFAGTNSAQCRPALLSRSLGVVGGSRAQVRLRWAGSGRCSGTVTLRARMRSGRRLRTVTIGAASFALASNRTAIVAVRLTRTGSLLFRRGHGRLGASLQLAGPGRGARVASTTSVRLVTARTAPKKKH